MSKLFDRLEKVVFNAANTIFGSSAIWVSADGTVTYTGTVLLNTPTAKESVDQMSFVEADSYIEYLDPAFPGLKLFVDNKSEEVIAIDGVEYVVTAVDQLYDGNNFKAYLQLVNNNYGPKNQ